MGPTHVCTLVNRGKSERNKYASKESQWLKRKINNEPRQTTRASGAEKRD